MLRTLEPQKEAENKNAEADFKNPCSYKMESVLPSIQKVNLEIELLVASNLPSNVSRGKEGW